MSGVLGMPYFITLHTGLQPPAADASQDVKDAFSIPASQKSLITSILSAGTFFGALIGELRFDAQEQVEQGAGSRADEQLVTWPTTLAAGSPSSLVAPSLSSASSCRSLPTRVSD